MNDRHRRPLASLSFWGLTYLRPQSPYIVAWWSAAFPGFGHYLVNHNVRATLFTLSEFATNTLSHVNEAIVFSFCGDFAAAKGILRLPWLFGYITIYFFAIWDSYRSALTQNKLHQLAEMANEPIPAALLHPLEFQYLAQRKPATAAFYSFLFPGLGQLYNHQFGIAFYAMIWWWFYLTVGRVHESAYHLVMGNVQYSVAMLNPQWLLFMPSIWGGSIYYAFVVARDHNRLFRREQRQYLAERYRDSEVIIFP